MLVIVFKRCMDNLESWLYNSNPSSKKLITEVKTTSKTSKNLVLFVYLLLLGVIGPALFWFINQKPQAASKTESSAPKEAVSRANNPSEVESVQQRLSLGALILVTEDNQPEKQAAVQAYEKGDYATAVTKFSAVLQSNRNDPESLIYLNNSKAAIKGQLLKIGTSVPVGGNLNVAREILRGVAQAQNEINQAGGIDGKLLQVEIANDNNDPAIAQQIAAAFVKDTSILAVIGHNASEASIAAAPIYQEGGLVMISPTSVARNLSGIGSHIFRTTPNSKAMANALASYVTQTARKTKVAVCSASKTEASQSFQEEFTTAFFENGGKVINIPCDFSDPNFNASDVPSKAISAGAEALVLAPSLSSINQSIDILQAAKRKLTVFGSQTMYGIETLKQGQSDANGMVLAVPWHPSLAVGSAFAMNAKKLWGGSGNWRTAMSYDATWALRSGLQSGATREQLQKSLSNSGFSAKGATGVVQFLPSGDRMMKVVLVKVQPGKESGTGYDFAALKPIANSKPVEQEQAL
jgi:branched-chain amino acid transport system substrate-binding protein